VRLLNFCAEIGQPLVGCHGLVGRVRAISTQAEERAVFLQAVRQIAEHARPLGLRLVMEVLNRYEAHLLNTAAEAVQFVGDADADNVGILLDAYHMNIEEANPADAIRHAGKRLWLYHVADSNRQGIGRGHTDFGAQAAALREIGYEGPVIVECTAPGPDPFTPIKGDDSLSWLETFLLESREWLSKTA
jgi:D-psicose/D-tagatose/L-ribulose 3-epimerase